MTAIGRSAPAVAVLAKWTVDEQQLGVARRPSGPSAVARAPQHRNYISHHQHYGKCSLVFSPGGKLRYSLPIDVPVLYSHIQITTDKMPSADVFDFLRPTQCRRLMSSCGRPSRRFCPSGRPNRGRAARATPC